MRNNLFWSLALIILLAACDSQGVYEENASISANSWNLDSVATFRVPMADSITVFNVKLNVRNTTSYPNSNLYLFVTVSSPGGAMVRDTVECFLANDRGKWLGKGVGIYRDNQIPYRMYVRFPEEGIYTFKLQHGMRLANLNGIGSVGVRIERSEK